MDAKLINIGFGNTVVSGRVIAVMHPKSSPMKKLKEAAKSAQKLIDATEGRRTRALIITDSSHVILSSVQPETLMMRFLPLSELSREETP
jgi:hypothetical protein